MVRCEHNLRSQYFRDFQPMGSVDEKQLVRFVLGHLFGPLAHKDVELTLLSAHFARLVELDAVLLDHRHLGGGLWLRGLQRCLVLYELCELDHRYLAFLFKPARPLGAAVGALDQEQVFCLLLIGDPPLVNHSEFLEATVAARAEVAHYPERVGREVLRVVTA